MYLVSTTEAMALLKYKDRYSFLKMLRRRRVPVIRLNSRVFRIRREDLERLISR